MGGSSKRVARRKAVKEWRARALRLRAAGWTLTQVANHLGKAVSTVHEACERELNAIPAEGVKQLRALKGAQLEAIIKGNLKKAKKGDANASFVVISAITAEAKLYGLNSSEKVDVAGTLTLTIDAHQELLDRLAKIADEAKPA